MNAQMIDNKFPQSVLSKGDFQLEQCTIDYVQTKSVYF